MSILGSLRREVAFHWLQFLSSLGLTPTPNSRIPQAPIKPSLGRRYWPLEQWDFFR